MVFWVFGYGSLVWNPGFEVDEKVIGFIKDYRRVFDVGMLFYLIISQSFQCNACLIHYVYCLCSLYSFLM